MSPRPRRLRVAPATTVLVAVLLAGCSAADGGTPSLRDQAGEAYISGDGSVQLVAEADREPVEGVAGETLDGGRLDLADLRGAPVVLNVWGSWCAPCHAEAPELVSAFEQLGGGTDDGGTDDGGTAGGGTGADEGADAVAAFVGIDIRDRSRQPALAFEEEYGIGWPSLYDPDSLHLLALRGEVPPQAVPATLVLDAEGRVAARIIGQVDSGTLVGIVTDVAEETDAA